MDRHRPRLRSRIVAAAVVSLSWTACATAGDGYDMGAGPGGDEAGDDAQKGGLGADSSHALQHDGSAVPDVSGEPGEQGADTGGGDADAAASDADSGGGDADANTIDADAGDDADASVSDANEAGDSGDDGDSSMNDANASDASDAGSDAVILCNGNNCTGCCDVNNVCQPGTTDTLCGTFPPGAACTDCTQQAATCIFWIVGYVCL